MLEIKAGSTYIADGVRTGNTDRGAFFLCKVKAEKGHDVITVWNNDGFKCSDGDSIRVDEIVSVKKSARKWQEKWYDEYSITARLSLSKSAPPKPISTPEDLPF